MYPRGHAGIAMIATVPFTTYFTGVPEFTVLVIIAMWTSVLPDIDVPICRRVQSIRHRGLTHTIWFVILFTSLTTMTHVLLSQWLFFSLKVSVIGVIIGVSSHVIADGFNRDGVRPFEIFGRFNYHLRLNCVKSDSYVVNNLLITVGTILVFGVLIVRI